MNNSISSESMNISSEELTEVGNVNRRSDSQFDLRYLESQERWEVSETLYNSLKMNENGFRMFVHPTHGVILKTQDVEDSTFYRGTKTKQFTARKLRTVLNSEGLTGDQFALVPADDDLFVVETWGDRNVSDLAVTNDQPTEDMFVPADDVEYDDSENSQEERTTLENPFE